MNDTDTKTPDWMTENAQPMRGDWHQNRAQLITGTDTSAILGLSPWATPFDVWLSKTGQEPPGKDAPHLQWGRTMEPVILNAYTERTGIEIIANATCYQSTRHKLLGGTPDAFGVNVPVIPDAKNVRFLNDKWGDEGTDQVPPQYVLQMQHYMIVTGATSADLAVLVGGNEFRVYTIIENKGLQSVIIDRASRFWTDHVNGNKPPQIEPSDTANKWLNEQFPQQKTELRDASACEVEMITQLRNAEATMKAASESIGRIEMQLKTSIGDAEGVKGGFGKITWKAGKPRKKTDWKAVEKANPALVAAHTTKINASRRFLKNWS